MDNNTEKELISEIMHSIETAALRRRLPFNKHILRPMTDQKIKEIIRTYDQTVYELYNGLCTNYDS